jgi:hypothetical protein
MMVTERFPAAPVLKGRVLWLVASVLVLLAMVGLGVTACGGADDTIGGTNSTAGQVAATTTTVSPSPAELGQAVAATWAEAIQRVVVLLRARPAVDSVRTQVAELKEEYVQRMLALGRQIAQLQLDGKALADSTIEAALEAAADTDWFREYVAIYDDYSDGDLDFAYLLASFNILTQYADFELLKAQDPEEAARLGIQ